MEWLKKLLEAATIKDGALDVTALMTSINAEFPKNAVPKETYNSVSEQLKTANKTIGDLKKDNNDNETLQATIKTHESTIATMKTDHETQIKEMTINAAIQSKLGDNKYAKLLSTQFDKSKLTVTDGNVIGLDEQFSTIKEAHKDLFTANVTGGKPNNTGGSQAPAGKRAELETVIKDPKTTLAERIAAKNQLFNLESEE